MTYFLKFTIISIMLTALLNVETQAQVKIPPANCSSFEQGKNSTRFGQTLQAVFIPGRAKSNTSIRNANTTNLLSIAAYTLAAVSVYSYFQSKNHYNQYEGMEVNSLQRENSYTKANNYNKIAIVTGAGAGILFTSNIIFTYLQNGNGRRYAHIEKKWTSPAHNQYLISLSPEANTQHLGFNLALKF